jgi:AraC-like DNA-binding protein
MNSELSFDRHAFEKPPHIVSQASRLDFSDRRGMGVIRRKQFHEQRRKFTPLFAMNDSQLRLVLAQAAWSFAHNGHYSRMPDDLANDWRALEALCAKRTAQNRIGYKDSTDRQRQLAWKGILLNEHFGYLALRAKVATLAWKMGYSHSEVSAEFNGDVSLCHVRQILARLCAVARRLGFETFPVRHHTFGREKCWNKLGRKWTKEKLLELFRLRFYGASWEQLAKHFGLKHAGSAWKTYVHYFGHSVRCRRAQALCKITRLPRGGMVVQYRKTKTPARTGAGV